MTKEERFELIEKHLAGQLTTEEQAAFEKHRQEDPSFDKEVVLHSKAQQYLKGEKIHSFRNILQEVNREWQAPGKPEARVFSLNRMTAAAAVLLLLMAAAWFLFRQDATNSKTLFADHFAPYGMVLNQRSDSAERDLLLAIEAYQQKRYASATEIFQQLSEQEPENKVLFFYYGLSNLAQGNALEAIPVLRALTESPDQHLLLEQSRWYLALAYLHANEKMQAKKILQQIKAGNYKYEEAQALISKLP